MVPKDVILGIGFGDVLPGGDAVLISLLVRTQRDGRSVEGIRDPLILHRSQLETLREWWPTLLAQKDELGLDAGTFEPPARGIAWNEGPSLAEATRTGLYTCYGFGFKVPDPTDGAAVVVLEVKSPLDASPDADREPEGVDYLFPFSGLVAFVESIPKVLRKMDQRASTASKIRH